MGLAMIAAARGLGWIIRWFFFRFLWGIGGPALAIGALVVLGLSPLVVRRWRQRRNA